ncbi:MAG: NAD(+)/NADH kinase [Epulopiscium sp.]|nr:NAD(+)/NADH kinase [Candidatus Epulonipiscium sp.]
MKIIGLVPNLKKDIDLQHTRSLIQWLEQKKIQVKIPQTIGGILGRIDLECSIELLYQQADFLVALGGDGTILSTARQAAPFSKPILGVNLGKLGFLAEVEKTASFTALEQILQGHYTIEKRMMLDAIIISQNKILSDPFIALNDAVITRGSFSRMADLYIYVNNEFVNRFSADGIIISTPTGSTGYNLSAGGPIIHPSTEAMVITPICSHSLYARSFVVSQQDIVTIHIGGQYIDQENNKIEEEIPHEMMLTLDGQLGYSLQREDKIVIQKSSYYTHLIKTTEQNFYDIVRKKIVGGRK